MADATQNTGFPPLLLDGIDFGAAYIAQLQAQQAQQSGSDGGESEAPTDETPIN
jgi:preprotein translocase subunit SecB